MPFPYNVICFDNDGTLSLAGKPIGPIVEKLVRLRRNEGVRLLMITNNTSKDDKTYVERLAAMGFPAGLVEVISPIAVAAERLKQLGLTQGYILGNSLCVSEFERRGIHQETENAQFVLVAYDTTLTYEKLVSACALVKKGLPLFQTHIDPVCPGDPVDLPDCGLMIELITRPTGVTPQEIFGKESQGYAQYLQRQLRPSENAVIVGDRLKTDMALAATLQWDGAWINGRAGETSGGENPAYSFPTFVDFLDHFGH